MRKLAIRLAVAVAVASVALAMAASPASSADTIAVFMTGGPGDIVCC